MTLKPWLLATLVIVMLGIGVVIGTQYQPPPPKVQVTIKENSCIVSCPADSAFPSKQGSVECTAGSAPLCQCTDAQQQMAGCVPLN